VEVLVKAVQSGRLVRGLRVWYAPKLSKQDSQSFSVLTTDIDDKPAKATIFIGDYCFWAAKDSAPTPVTNEQCEKLYLNNKIELSVKE
jgi:hypothetical protein